MLTRMDELGDDLGDELGDEFDSIEGRAQRPNALGTGDDDSVMYVVYQQRQCLPEFIVTYTEA